MNWAGNVGGFLEAFKEGLGGLFGKEGTNLDGQEYINGQDPNYLKLDWKQRKKYDESEGGDQSYKKDLYDNYVMQGNPVIHDFAGTGKRMNEVGLNPWGSGETMFAGAPRFIKYGGPANSIVRPINVDSRHMDHLLNERRKMMGVQLPPFV